MEYADEKLAGTGISCYVCPGNDDIFEVDDVIASSKSVMHAEGKVVQLDEHHEMDSSGWSNPTPWDTHRDEPDKALENRIETVIAQASDPGNAVSNLHPPPYGSGIDEAPELTEDLRPTYAGRALIPVGSQAVLHVIEKYQPLLGLK
jgi:hypothetical protein